MADELKPETIFDMPHKGCDTVQVWKTTELMGHDAYVCIACRRYALSLGGSMEPLDDEIKFSIDWSGEGRPRH